MPTQQQHLSKALGNEAFARSLRLDSTASIDWALIAAFYAAVHFVEAYFSRSNRNSASHKTRSKQMMADGYLQEIDLDFRRLSYYGFNARYEAQTFNAEDVLLQAFQALTESSLTS